MEKQVINVMEVFYKFTLEVFKHDRIYLYLCKSDTEKGIIEDQMINILLGSSGYYPTQTITMPAHLFEIDSEDDCIRYMHCRVIATK